MYDKDLYKKNLNLFFSKKIQFSLKGPTIDYIYHPSEEGLLQNLFWVFSRNSSDFIYR